MQIETACIHAMQLRQECPQILRAQFAEYLASCQPAAQEDFKATIPALAKSSQDSWAAVQPELQGGIASAASKLPAIG